MGPLIPFKPGQISLRKQAILTEEEYTAALSAVIKRDFFPSLDRVTAENEYLTAVESDDPRRIRVALNRLLRFDQQTQGAVSAAQSKSSTLTPRPRQASERGEWDDTPLASSSSKGIFNPTFTPAADSTLGEEGSEGEEEDQEDEPGSGINPDLELSLSDFQSRYTSEDNASFSQLLDRDNQLRKRKHAHLFAREQASEQRRKRITQAEEEDAKRGRRLAIEANPDHPKLLEQAKTETLLIEDAGKGKSKETARTASTENIEATKDPLDDLILVPEPRKDDRPTLTGLNRWKYTARNALMYGPDANVSSLHASPHTTSSHSAAEKTAENEPQTNFTALRLPADDDAEFNDKREASEAGWSPSSSRIDAAIERGRAGSASASTIDSAGMGVVETPKVNGYGFVTPYSTPQHQEDEEMHLKIYNSIKARRRAAPRTSTLHSSSADGEEGSGREFQLPRLDKREEVAQRLMATASSPKPSERAGGGATPYGMQRYTGLAGLRARAFAPSPIAAKRKDLTPAAKALLDRSTRGLTPSLTGSTTSGGGLASPIAPTRNNTKGLSERGWTPTPQHTQRRS